MSERPLAVARGATRTRGPLPFMLGAVSILWLPFGLANGIGDVIASHLRSPSYVAMTLGTVLFIAIYVWGICMNVVYLRTTVPPLGRTKIYAWVTFALLFVLSIIMIRLNEKDWGALLIFVSSYISSRFRLVEAICLICVTALIPIIGFVMNPANVPDVWQGLFLVGIVGFIVIAVVRAYRGSQELRMAREEIALLAVTTERLRIARDLHDLLGHNLSLITLKSELAGRLLDKDIERAGSEIRDIEQVARTTLQEVREAVGSYRQPTLASELHGAQEILTAAGIAYSLDSAEQRLDDLPRPVESVLAWTVREGVTNIIRHSHARHCSIKIVRTPHLCTIEMCDDGAGTTNEELEHRGGNGLRGLTERIEALGGQFSAGPLPAGGFCLTAAIPIADKGVISQSVIGRGGSGEGVVGMRAIENEKGETVLEGEEPGQRMPEREQAGMQIAEPVRRTREERGEVL